MVLHDFGGVQDYFSVVLGLPNPQTALLRAPGPPGQVQKLQDRSRTYRSISRMNRSSSRTFFQRVFLRFKMVLGGFVGVAWKLKNGSF